MKVVPLFTLGVPVLGCFQYPQYKVQVDPIYKAKVDNLIQQLLDYCRDPINHRDPRRLLLEYRELYRKVGYPVDDVPIDCPQTTPKTYVELHNFKDLDGYFRDPFSLHNVPIKCEKEEKEEAIVQKLEEKQAQVSIWLISIVVGVIFVVLAIICKCALSRLCSIICCMSGSDSAYSSENSSRTGRADQIITQKKPSITRSHEHIHKQQQKTSEKAKSEKAKLIRDEASDTSRSSC